MSSPFTYMGQPELTAISALFGKTVHVHLDDTTLPPPAFATIDDIHLRYNASSRHYDTYQLIIPDNQQLHAAPSGPAIITMIHRRISGLLLFVVFVRDVERRCRAAAISGNQRRVFNYI